MPEPMNLEFPSGNPAEQEQNPNPETPPVGAGLANPFLQTVDEADREIVARYINQWDAEAGKKIQALSEEVKPWKELGVDVNSVKAAVQTMMWAESNPQEFYEAIKAELEELGMLPGEESGNPAGSNPLPEYDGLPEPFVQKFTQMESTLSKMNEFIEETQNEKKRAAQEQQLDTLLADLHTRHGKFDEEAVLGRIIKGMSPEDAVKDHLKYIKEISTGPEPKNPPPVLTNGRTGVEQVDASKIRNDKKARTSLIADLLNANKG